MPVDLHNYRIICGDKAWKCRDRGHSDECYQRDPRLQDIADALANSIVSGFYCTTHKAIGQDFGCDEWLDGKPYRSCTMVEYVGYPKPFVDALIEEEQ